MDLGAAGLYRRLFLCSMGTSVRGRGTWKKTCVCAVWGSSLGKVNPSLGEEKVTLCTALYYEFAV